jgi:hypothetical protein
VKVVGTFARFSGRNVAPGQRQGELFAAAVDDIDFLRRNVRVQWQVKYAGGVLYYAPVKNQEAA